MGKSMYQYGKQTKEKDRYLKQVAKKLKRTLAKQLPADTADSQENTLPEGEVITEGNDHE